MKLFQFSSIGIRTCACMAVGLAAMAVGCKAGNGGAPEDASHYSASGGFASGGFASGGFASGTTVSSSGGQGNGGASGSGGTSPGSGASAGTGAGGTSGLGGITGSGGVASGGMQSTGGSTRPATGGQGSGGSATGGKSAGGSTGTGGTGGMVGAGGSAAGGSGGPTSGGGGSGGGTTSPDGQGGRSAGGGSGSGGSVTGGSSGSGGAGSGGASSGGGTSSDYRPCPSDGSACKIMPFGDSITDGYNADTPGGYRVELFRRAHVDGKNITFVGNGWNGPSTVDGVSFPPRHEGHSGWTIYPAGNRKGISQCLQASPDCLSTGSVMPAYKPDIVLLMIGTNDAIDNYDMANAPKRLGDLIDTIYSQLPTVLILVAQPIPSRGDGSKGDDTALSARIKSYDDAIPAVVKTRADAGKHILIVDMYTPFNTNKAALIEDQWHPNLQGYVVLGTQWYSVLKPLL